MFMQHQVLSLAARRAARVFSFRSEKLEIADCAAYFTILETRRM